MDKIKVKQGTAADIIRSLGITEEEIEQAKQIIEELKNKELREDGRLYR